MARLAMCWLRTLIDTTWDAEGPFVAVGAVPIVNNDQALQLFFPSCVDAVFGSTDEVKSCIGSQLVPLLPPHSQKDKRTGRFLLC